MITPHRALNIALALGIAAVLSTAWHIDDLPSAATERSDTAQSVQDAQRHAQRQARFDKAAARMCGGNGTWVLLPDNEIQCQNRRSQVTRIAKVAL